MTIRRQKPDYHCPMCGHEPRLIISDEQAVCGNENDDECLVIFFSPMEEYTPEDLAGAQVVTLEKETRPDAV